MNMGRLFFIVLVWFAMWMIGGAIVAGSGGALVGFILAYLIGFALPWIAPRSLQDWMEQRNT